MHLRVCMGMLVHMHACMCACTCCVSDWEGICVTMGMWSHMIMPL